MATVSLPTTTVMDSMVVWGGFAGDGAIIGFAVDPQDVVLIFHQLVFGGREDAGPDDDLDIVVLEGHEVEAEILYGDGCQLGFSDAFVEGCQGEGGDIISDILFPDLAEIVFLVGGSRGSRGPGQSKLTRSGQGVG